MAQHTDIVLNELSYTRTDYTALRAYAQRIPMVIIADRYYSEDSPQIAYGLERFLIQMRDNLIERAIEHNPHFAEILKGARQGGSLTVRALDILFKAADAPKAVPALHDPISKWFRPKTVVALRNADLITLEHLVAWIRARDRNWYKSIPRIGKLRADIIVKFINSHSHTLGEIVYESVEESNVQKLVLDPRFPSKLAPLEMIAIPPELSGTRGINRAPNFCYLSGARDEVDIAIAYLTRFTNSPHTYRAYQKEIERFILFCILILKKPVASVLIDDCIQYQSFLVTPAPSFVGAKVPRSSKRWRPFSSTPMSLKSQLHALTIVRSFFNYLVAVRYLAGNPWFAVSDPKATEQVYPIEIGRALENELWEKLINYLTEKSKAADHLQDRICLIALLLMGDSGLRRSEVIIAQRNKLRLYSKTHEVYILEITGKGRKNRLVPVSQRTVDALIDHFADRGLDFDNQDSTSLLLSPVLIPSTDTASAKHKSGLNAGYSLDALNKVVKALWKRIEKDSLSSAAFSADELAKLKGSTPHAFRHTFGTLAMETGMEIDVTQTILGHKSQQTTAIYAKTREKRIAAAASLFFSKGKVDDRNN